MQAPVLETERLTLRPFSRTDVDGLVRELMSDPEVMASLPQDPRTAEEQVACAEQYIATYSAPWAVTGYGGWVVCSRTSEFAVPAGEFAVPAGTLLGFCGFEPGQLDGEGAELGFGYGKGYWGKGIGSEAAAAAVEWYFISGGHERFYACFDPWNNGSKSILQKIGMTHSRDEDLWGSVDTGIGLLPVYTLDRQRYLTSRGSPKSV
jgi:RimJ/RimL family protein N-acetyltransferase